MLSTTTAPTDKRMRKCEGFIYRLAYSVLRNREDAEDVAKDTFVKAYIELGGLRDDDRFHA